MATEKIEATKENKSATIFKGINDVRFTWASSQRALQAFFPDRGPMLTLGGTTVDLPDSLRNRTIA